MGACATKPKADATDAPAPLPEKLEVVKNDLTVSGPVIETKEVVDVGILSKESGQVKGSTENDKTQPETVKDEAREETTSTPTVSAVEVETEKAIEVETATEKIEISVERTIPVVDASAKVETEESIEVEPANEKTETSEEKTSTPISYAPVVVEADKEIEVAPAIEVEKTEAVEEKKIEEHDKAIETTISEPNEVESASRKTEVVKETEKALEEKTTGSEGCAENVKP